MRIGILGNDPELIRLLRLALQMAFYEKAKRWAKEPRPLLEGLDVHVGTSGEEALAWFTQHEGVWDAWFVDVSAARQGALEFIAACHGPLADRCGRCVALAERGDGGGAQWARAAGADAVLLKPFTPEDVWRHLEARDLGLPPQVQPAYIQPGGTL